MTDISPSDVEHPSLDEVEFVSECPACGTVFVGISPCEFRETHAIEDCPKAPIPALVVFPTPEQAAEIEERQRV